MNQKTGTPPKQFSIDPPSTGTVTNPSVPENHELSRASASQIILMGDSKTSTSSLYLLLTLANPLRVFRHLVQKYPRTYIPNSTPWRNKQRLTSHVRSHYSQVSKIIGPFYMTRFANWMLAPTIQSYGGYNQ